MTYGFFDVELGSSGMAKCAFCKPEPESAGDNLQKLGAIK